MPRLRHEISEAIERYRVNSVLVPRYWADIGTVSAFYDANMMLASLTRRQLLRSARPIYTHPRFLPGPAERLLHPPRHRRRGVSLDRCTIEDSVVGIRTEIQAGAQVRRSWWSGLISTKPMTMHDAGDGPRWHRPRRRARSRNRRQERADRRRRAARE